MQYTIDFLRQNNLIIFEAISGSHAYGTSLPTSDTDIRGVFVQPLDDIFKYGYVDQVTDSKNDICFYELKRFMDLVVPNNPNIIELLFVSDDCILHTSEEWKMIQHHAKEFLTKKCKFTFGSYAIEQIKKAKGYNKKINWEESKMIRKTVLDFCYILHNVGSIAFSKWLENNQLTNNIKYTQKDFGLSNIDHAHDIYALYNLYDFDQEKGIVDNEETSNDVKLTSIPKAAGKPIAYLTFNKDAYSTHCKEYNEYQKWLKERNEDRFKMNKEHGKQYDSKNLMHTFRLLKVAEEIATTCNLNVRRPDDEIKLLMQIRRGEFEYDQLVNEATKIIDNLDKKYEESALPLKIDDDLVKDLLLKIRKLKYGLSI